jgi:hypothetical protein
MHVMLCYTYNVCVYMLCMHKGKKRLCQGHKINILIIQCAL